MADAAIDIYSMAVVLSRCSFVLSKSAGDDALHDLQITQLFLRLAAKRAENNISEAAKPSVTGTRLIGQIAQAVCDNQAIIHEHPLSLLR